MDRPNPIVSDPEPLIDRAPRLTQKSARTRGHILDVLQKLLAEKGYDGAGNAALAEACGLTRGAMLYHYPNRRQLIEAAALHIHQSRQKLFEAEAARAEPGQDALDAAIDAYWRLLSSEPFSAFLALERAARYDQDVASAIRPAQEAFDRGHFGQAAGFFQAGSETRFQLSRDLARFTLDGLHRAQLTYQSEDRRQAVLAVIKRAVHMLNRKGDIHDLWTE